jgi:hypothetical protein
MDIGWKETKTCPTHLQSCTMSAMDVLLTHELSSMSSCLPLHYGR